MNIKIKDQPPCPICYSTDVVLVEYPKFLVSPDGSNKFQVCCLKCRSKSKGAAASNQETALFLWKVHSVYGE